MSLKSNKHAQSCTSLHFVHYINNIGEPGNRTALGVDSLNHPALISKIPGNVSNSLGESNLHKNRQNGEFSTGGTLTGEFSFVESSSEEFSDFCLLYKGNFGQPTQVRILGHRIYLRKTHAYRKPRQGPKPGGRWVTAPVN